MSLQLKSVGEGPIVPHLVGKSLHCLQLFSLLYVLLPCYRNGTHRSAERVYCTRMIRTAISVA